MYNIERPFHLARAARDAHAVRLADGARVRLRASGNDDYEGEAFRRLFFTLSDSTRYLYFCAGIPANALWAERFGVLSRTDGERSYVMVAEVGDDLVGFARFSQGPHADPDERGADVGILLTDAWQGRGLGGHMLCRLAAEAYKREVTTLTAVVLWENRRMLRLARRHFPDMRSSYGSGTCEITVDLASWWANADERMCG